jgi:preprotein translocase subunit SecA
MGVLKTILRAGEGRKVRALRALVADIGALEPEMQALTDAGLAARTVDFRKRFDAGEDLNDMLIEAFAVTREASVRVYGKRHYDEQLMGGAALHFGWIAEMKTGEGKTLASTLPVYLNGLTGRGVHVVTVNDYLARRDGEQMQQLMEFLGLTAGLVTADQSSAAAKRAAYACDVTHGTNNEFGFDYLRDNMAQDRASMVQRGHVYAIVDEVDSILIDEARTPLIISGPASDSTKLYYQFAGIVRRLERDADYEVDEKKRTIAPTEDGIEKVEKELGVDNMYDLKGVNFVHQLSNALKAKELFKLDKDYVVQDGEVKIVDEFTGRILEGRRWSDGLHQAVEAKERVRINEENHTLATVTLQNYFRLYDKLAGMTGTAETEASEFMNTYGLAVVPIPTHRDMIRADEADLIYRSEKPKFEAIGDEIEERHAKGQPILVGTASVERSEYLSQVLSRRGITHNVLNAKQHTREAMVIAQAGRFGAVTVATNMAGRGVDILLGGNPELLAAQATIAEGLDPNTPEGRPTFERYEAKYEAECQAEGRRVREAGGLYVLGTERHESRRIDNQLRGRSGRQGDPGASRFFLSLEDELLRLFATGALNYVMGKAMTEDVPIESGMVTKSVERAQGMVESRNGEIRKDVLKYDEVMDKQRKTIYAERARVIDGADLREQTVEMIEAMVDSVVHTSCPADDRDEWNLETLIAELTSYYPTTATTEDFAEAEDTSQLIETLTAEAMAYYQKREASIAGGPNAMRELERKVMLFVIDAKWREHLAEMDYLREGINLRAMGQQDPLVAWQAEGFKMFNELLGSITDEYVQLVLRANVVADDEVDESLTYTSGDGTGDVVAVEGTSARDIEAANVRQRAGAPLPAGVAKPGAFAATPALSDGPAVPVSPRRVAAGAGLKGASGDARKMTREERRNFEREQARKRREEQ